MSLLCSSLLSAKGCHLCCSDTEWLVGVGRVSEEFSEEERASLPDIMYDDSDGLLSVSNTSMTHYKTIFLSLFHQLVTEEGLQLEGGSCRNEEGHDLTCVTLICLLPPDTLFDIGFVDGAVSGPSLTIHSDIKDVEKQWFESTLVELRQRYPNSECHQEASTDYSIDFPLALSETTEPAVLCSQGFGGQFTHFYPATFHSIDLQCAVGTPVVAVADGLIVDVRDSHNVSGIDVRNLFLWNSVTLRIERADACDIPKRLVQDDEGDFLFVEYVHIAQGSAKVSVGDRVTRGDVICLTGDVGFCPIAHLHLQVQPCQRDDAQTLPFQFRRKSGERFSAKQGHVYNSDGEVTHRTG